MVIGYVLINVETSKEDEVLREILQIPEVIEAHPLFGEYDIIAKVSAKDVKEFSQVVLKKIRKIDGVVSTKTLMGAHEEV